MTNRPLHITIAGGGTGGHLFPGIAIAQEFMERNENNRVTFVSTGRPLERSVLPAYGFELRTISAEGIKGRGFLRQARALWKLKTGLVQSIFILKKNHPHLVIGMGSYSAAPVILAAKVLRKPIVLCEQNILPGITNRLLSRFADQIFISFPDTQRLNPAKALYTGNPVRKELLEACDKIREDRERFFTILVLDRKSVV